MARKYTVLQIVNCREIVVLETTDREEARACYLKLQDDCAGRVRIDNGQILPIWKADRMFRRKGKAPQTVGAVMKGQETDITNIITPERSESNV